jgi:homoserine acetyltransferase
MAKAAPLAKDVVVTDHETFELGPLTLQCGLTLPRAHLAYKTYGTLAPDKSNVVLYPTSITPTSNGLLDDNVCWIPSTTSS